MIQAMLASMSSIEAQQQRMDVIGNNLANVNTTGFKGSDTDFEDMVSQVIRQGVDPLQFGMGVMVGSTITDESQGTMDATGSPSNLAIQGNGYFVVANQGGMAYTRDGTFTLNANGELVSSTTGDPVLGWASANGSVNNTTPLTAASTITLPLGTLSDVQATSAIALGGNLQSTAANTATASVSVNAFDSLGASQNITITFSNPTSPPGAGAPAGATSSWNWTATQGATTLGSSSGAGNQPLYFNASGQLINTTALGNITIPASGGAGATNIQVNFGDITQNSGSSDIQSTSVNGAPPGSLQDYTIGTDGTITGVFSNGLTEALGQIALANFSNPQGLTSLGGNMYQQSFGSGPAQVGSGGTNGLGTIQSGFLEESNVDVGTQFTNLIVTQRGYEANTKVVTAVDQMLQDLLSMTTQ